MAKELTKRQDNLKIRYSKKEKGQTKQPALTINGGGGET
jgi:hypothetical protein